MRTQHEELIRDSADLHALSLETLTAGGMEAMTDLLDRIETNLILSVLAARAPATARA